MKNQNSETCTLERNTAFYGDLLAALPVPLFYRDAEGVFRYCNPGFARVFGLREEDVLGKTPEELASCGAHEPWIDDTRLLATGGTEFAEVELPAIRGGAAVYQLSKSALTSPGGDIIGVVGLMNDVTRYHRQVKRNHREIALRDAVLKITHAIVEQQDSDALLERLLDIAIRLMPHADAGSVLRISEDGYLYVTSDRGYVSGGKEQFRIRVEDTFVYHQSQGMFSSPGIINDIQQKVRAGTPDTIETTAGGAVESCISVPILVDGDRMALINVDSFQNHAFNQEDLEFLSFLKAQAELALTNMKLYRDTLRLSRYDTLTGACNRRYFEEQLDALTEGGEPFVFAIMDMDGLKSVNDLQGHREGDRSITAFAECVQQCLEPYDVFGRYGGDEFVAVFRKQSPEQVAEKLDCARRLLVERHALCCSFSYGICQYPLEGATVDQLVRIADQRLYDSKRTRKKQERIKNGYPNK